jgi:2-dehydropantoate 2-reductase
MRVYNRFAIDTKKPQPNPNPDLVNNAKRRNSNGNRKTGGREMRIAVLGSGAMGSLFGGFLSQRNEVWLVDIDSQKVDKISRDGVTIHEPDGERMFFPKAVCNTAGLGVMDLIIVFVKAMHSRSALSGNKALIGADTYVMTLQNGAGHEETLLEFVARERVIIGTTQHNGSLTENGHVHHGGGGKTNIGLVNGNSQSLQSIAKNFTECGLETFVSDDIKRLIWNKLFLNVSASVLTGILQVKLGYLLDNVHGWFLVERLAREAVTVANADEIDFDPEEVLGDIKILLGNAYEGYTSIYADLRNGMLTEVDTISGSVVKEAKRHGISVPCHKFVVELVHAMEDKKKIEAVISTTKGGSL